MQDIVDYAINLPVLTLEEERELVQDYIATGSERAAHKLVLHHMKIVIPMAYNLRRHRIDVNDLIQEGNLGLMNALKNYDPSSSARFGTFARSYVRSAMLDYMLCNYRIAKIATTQEQRKCFFNLGRFKNDTTVPMSDSRVEEAAKSLGVSVETVRDMDARLSFADMSTDVDEYEIPTTIFTEEVEREEWHNKTMKKVNVLIDSLDDRTRDIMRTRWMGEEQSTLKQLAQKYGVSTSRIGEIEKLTIAKIRDKLSDNVC